MSAKKLAIKRPEEILRDAASDFKRRCPGMSVRAVAARLEISPSYWSKILRGQKPLTQNLLPRVVEVLGLDAQQVARLQRAILDSIEHDQLEPLTGLRVSRENFQSPIETYGNLNQKSFWILEEWYYIPVMNLFTLANFSPTAEKISRRLDLPLEVIEAAITRLKHYGFLRAREDGVLERTELKLRFPTSQTHATVRKYHQQMIAKAREELLQTQAAERFLARLISSVSFAGSSHKLNEARMILEEAMYRAANLMADEPQSDEIYQLNIQIFPLSK